MQLKDNKSIIAIDKLKISLDFRFRLIFLSPTKKLIFCFTFANQNSLSAVIDRPMSRNTATNRKIVKDKIAKKKQKEQEAEAKRKALLKEIVNQFTIKK